MPYDPSSLMKMQYGPKRGFCLGHEDPILKTNRWRCGYPKFAELDPYVYDPPVTDSQISMIDGADSSRIPMHPFIYKYTGMPYDVWRHDVLYRQNPTIKNIYAKWDISPEHPGMKFRTTMKSEFTYEKYHGQFMNSLGFVKRIGGRYFDAPNGEQCFVKMWAPVKFALGWTSLVWLWDCVHGTQPIGWPNRWKMLFRINYLPLTAAAAWGGTSCILCDIRKKDDNWNYLWGAFAFGSVFGLRLGTIRGFQVGLIATFLTMGWRLCQDFEQGWLGYMAKERMTTGSALSRERVQLDTNWRELPEQRW